MSRYRKKDVAGQALRPQTQMMSFGYDPALSEGAIKPPLFQTSTFVFKSAEDAELSNTPIIPSVAYDHPSTAPSNTTVAIASARAVRKYCNSARDGLQTGVFGSGCRLASEYVSRNRWSTNTCSPAVGKLYMVKLCQTVILGCHWLGQCCCVCHWLCQCCV